MASWLHAPDPSMTYNNLQKQHHEGTGNWFLQIEEYRSWIESPGSVLWIKGKRMSSPFSASTIRHLNRLTAGNGKSVLWWVIVSVTFCGKLTITLHSSNLIRRLQVDSRTRKIHHVYYFFNFRDPSTQTSENFLRSILSQLLHSLPDIPDVIAELYSQCNSGTLRPSNRDMTDCFIAVVSELDEVRGFGDAFDECTDWNDLWYFLSTTIKSRCPGFRFLFTSRPEEHIHRAVNSLEIPSVDLDCEGINKDIEVFVSGSLKMDIRFAHILGEGKTLIRKSLISRANGMCVPPLASFQ
jgi:hypothetical protein